MSKTIKFAVSMSEEVFKELESLRRRTGWTRSQFIRDAVRAWKEEFSEPSAVKEKAEEYKMEIPSDIIDPEERRRRAIAAAGRFRSDISDLSSNHDKYLEESYAATAPKKAKKRARRDL
jgi:predicted DNA-binding protein